MLRPLAIVLSLFSYCTAHAAPLSAGAAPPIVIETVDGRALQGVVDQRSDARALWLRREEGAVALTAAIAWTNIHSVAVDGATWSVDDLQRRYASMATAAAPPAPPEPARAPLAAPSAHPAKQLRLLNLPRRGARFRKIDLLDVRLANLDRDVEPDGIEVALAAVADDGLPLAVRGSLRATLYGQRRPVNAAAASFDQLDEWTQMLRPEDFVCGVARVCLPFQSTAPEQEFDLMPDAVLTVELGAFGYGNFAASAPVAVRPFNPLRDDLQLSRRTRFLPAELHGPPARRKIAEPDGRWIHWTW
ncbi:MAG: hypothetical protein IT424_03380 [Pirellulales bacterium]|nr:hypothetical protein [Pirellulales bacterium]